jgi:hypothetical protein
LPLQLASTNTVLGLSVYIQIVFYKTVASADSRRSYCSLNSQLHVRIEQAQMALFQLQRLGLHLIICYSILVVLVNGEIDPIVIKVCFGSWNLIPLAKTLIESIAGIPLLS